VGILEYIREYTGVFWQRLLRIVNVNPERERFCVAILELYSLLLHHELRWTYVSVHNNSVTIKVHVCVHTPAVGQRCASAESRRGFEVAHWLM
jgi:hypothetical protein